MSKLKQIQLPALIWVLSVYIIFVAEAHAACSADKCQMDIYLPANSANTLPVITSMAELNIGQNVTILESESKAGAIASIIGDSVIGSGSKVGSVFANKVLLKSKSKVEGSIIAKEIVQEDRVVVASSMVPPQGQMLNATSIDIKLPSYSATTPKIKVNPFTRMPLRPGRYKNVMVSERSELAMTTGIYFFDSFDVQPGAKVSIDTRDGTVYLFILSDLSHSGSFSYKGTASDLVINYFGENTIEITGELDANLYAPFAKVEIRARDSEVVHNGSLYAGSVIIGNASTFRAARATNSGKAFTEISSKISNATHSEQLLLGLAKPVILPSEIIDPEQQQVSTN